VLKGPPSTIKRWRELTWNNKERIVFIQPWTNVTPSKDCELRYWRIIYHWTCLNSYLLFIHHNVPTPLPFQEIWGLYISSTLLWWVGLSIAYLINDAYCVWIRAWVASVKNAQVIQYEIYCLGCLVWLAGTLIREWTWYISCSIKGGVGCHLFEREGYIVDSWFMAFVLVKDHSTQYLLHQTPLSPPVMAKLNNDK